MERYTINGHEVEYDTFDLVNMEIFRNEADRVANAANTLAESEPENYITSIRTFCEEIMDAFDTVLGDGASVAIFGGKVNAKIIPEAWKDFYSSVLHEMNPTAAKPATVVSVNREQRRAAERQARRDAAATAVAARSNHANN